MEAAAKNGEEGKIAAILSRQLRKGSSRRPCCRQPPIGFHESDNFASTKRLSGSAGMRVMLLLVRWFTDEVTALS
ncbi:MULTISPECIES: hypothetical protein [Chelativorans]|jgi:hypothetical protein|uniref:hypothetical protein n=1 Tax=Chelativorans TaxID=449972 RepID=UPI00030376D7|nr:MULTISPECIES: hypothetical protein [Chelativorans]